MHEASIAQFLIELVEDELRAASVPDGARVRRVLVRVGDLSGVVPQALHISVPSSRPCRGGCS